jgi:hypothetical protein
MHNSNCGYQEPFLLLATHSTDVPIPIEFAKFWNFEFGTGFGTLISAEPPGVWGLLECAGNERFLKQIAAGGYSLIGARTIVRYKKIGHLPLRA